MTFYAAANKPIDGIISDWHSRLIATGAWEDGDPGVSEGKVLHHLVETNIYIWLRRGRHEGPDGYNVYGILITVSSGWDSINHQPAGTIQRLVIPFAARRWGWTPVLTNVDIWEWNDANSIVAMMKNNTNDGNAHDYSAFFVMERITDKEYADAYSNFFFQVIPNGYSVAIWGTQWYEGKEYVIHEIQGELREYLSRFSNSPTTMYRLALRPYCDLGNIHHPHWKLYTQHSKPAWRSTGNAKVYFQFPVWHNTHDLNIPIARTKRWFAVQPGQGIADGDIIQWLDGAVTREYIYKSIASPDFAQTVDIAIGYNNMP